MRSLYPDRDYFRFLNELDDGCRRHFGLAAMMLANEFPALRVEEAKAVYCDWRRLRMPDGDGFNPASSQQGGVRAHAAGERVME